MKYVKKLNRSKIFSIIPLLLLTQGLTGCGKGNQLVEDVRARTYTNTEGQERLELVTVWNSGNLQIPSITLPIINPKQLSQKFGSLSVEPLIPAGLSVSVDLDFTEIAKVDGDDATLPNHKPVPINGLGGNSVLGFPVKDTGAKIYVALGDNLAVLGFALPIREFDKIGEKLGQSNLFIPFSFPYVRGSGGVFAGPNAGENGIALFVDVSEALQKGRGALASSQSKSLKRPVRRVEFAEQVMSVHKEEVLKEGLYKLHKRRARIHLN